MKAKNQRKKSVERRSGPVFRPLGLEKGPCTQEKILKQQGPEDCLRPCGQPYLKSTKKQGGLSIVVTTYFS
jgi:hypothetical protein